MVQMLLVKRNPLHCNVCAACQSICHNRSEARLFCICILASTRQIFSNKFCVVQVLSFRHVVIMVARAFVIILELGQQRKHHAREFPLRLKPWHRIDQNNMFRQAGITDISLRDAKVARIKSSTYRGVTRHRRSGRWRPSRPFSLVTNSKAWYILVQSDSWIFGGDMNSLCHLLDKL